MIDDFVVPLDKIAEYAEPWRYNAGIVGGGVYFLVDGDEVVYVGQASRICSRLNAHNKTDKVWQRYYDMEIPDKALRNAVESFYIASYCPKYNLQIEDVPEEIKHMVLPREQKTIYVKPLKPFW